MVMMNFIHVSMYLADANWDTTTTRTTMYTNK